MDAGVPRLDIQFETRDVKRREGPVSDGTERVQGRVSSSRRGDDPVTDRRAPKIDAPKPKADSPDASIAVGFGDDERVPLT
jgi:hypothetical protein